MIGEAGSGLREERLLFAVTCFVYGIGRGFVTAPLFNTVLSGVSAIINLGMLVIASALLFFIPKSRGRDIPRAEQLLVEG